MRQQSFAEEVLRQYWCRASESNRQRGKSPADFKPAAYANFASPAPANAANKEYHALSESCAAKRRFTCLGSALVILAAISLFAPALSQGRATTRAPSPQPVLENDYVRISKVYLHAGSQSPFTVPARTLRSNRPFAIHIRTRYRRAVWHPGLFTRSRNVSEFR